MRLDTALGEERAADGIGAEILERGEELLRRQRRVELVGLLAIPLGLVLWFVWWRRGAPRQRIGAGLSEPPWSGSEGLAVIVRSIVFGVGLMAVVAAFDSGGAGMEVFSLSTPWLALPLLVGIRIYLLGPHGLRFAPTFGLTVLEGEERGRRLVRLLGLVCALFALEHAGEVAIGTATDWLGLESRWSDELVPGLLLGSTARAATIAVDQILLAPVLYEIAFRGLLYQTLRTYLTPHLAALASAALFGLWFQQSLPGFLAILWSGYVWALAFEHTRSLVPGMLCHGLVNALALAHLATYR
jgi:hypothetical protein